MLLAALGIFIGGIVSGIRVESDHRDAQQLVQEQASATAYRQGVAQARSRADQLGRELATERARAETDRRGFRQNLEKAKRENKLGTCEKARGNDGASVDRIYLNTGLWNGALSIGRGASDNSGRNDDPPGAAGLTAIDEAYDNLGDNAERWARCRTRLIKWQALAVEKGWATGSPSPGSNDDGRAAEPANAKPAATKPPRASGIKGFLDRFR